MIDETFNVTFDWTNICISGGAVLGTLLKKPIGTKNSDIDFWIYGEDNKKTFNYLIKFLQSK